MHELFDIRLLLWSKTAFGLENKQDRARWALRDVRNASGLVYKQDCMLSGA